MISTACSWVNISGSQKATIFAQVGQFYSGAVGQYYIGANSYVLDALAATGLPSIAACEERFLPRRASMPTLNVRQHALSDYDLLNTVGGVHG
ncbi:hypothetical protein [Eoetvoesiella caeni]